MENIGFSVGARAARLIGRENIADVDGALVELIKNAYDADATCVMVRYHLPFPDVPSEIKKAYLYQHVTKKEDIDFLFSCYSEDKKNEKYKLKKELSQKKLESLKKALFSYNYIIISDNGFGMSKNTIKSAWMYIGISDKESNYISNKGRIKTGAKGIGRFALDKLSTFSKMITYKETDKAVIHWELDWDQFINATLISDVKAKLYTNEAERYDELVWNLFGDTIKDQKRENWKSGTTIILSPTRTEWSKRLFQKVNNNLSSINPIGSVDEFKVFIINDFLPELNYHTKEVSIDNEDFDYRIKICYDGINSVRITMLRNEVDITKKEVIISVDDKEIKKKTEEFWNRERFCHEGYHRNQYHDEIIKDYSIEKLLPNDSIEKIQMVGEFNAELYYIRKANNGDNKLIKKAMIKRRKSLLNDYSGIKLYRDDFKVRPYGDKGVYEDWLGLAGRVQKSPSAPASLTGRWRVEPYQMIGWVKIGRNTNPYLEDMANREGISPTETYNIFVDLLCACISKFEEDRQLFFREYRNWTEEIRRTVSLKEAHTVQIVESRHKNKDEEKKEQNITIDEAYNAIDYLVKKSEKEMNSQKLLQVLSSSGIILNTFFHEFSNINTQFHVQAAQIRSRINYILCGKEYHGLSAYNPYSRIEDLEKNDRLIAAFLDVVMRGAKQDALFARKESLSRMCQLAVAPWAKILEDRNIGLLENYDETDDDSVFMAEVDVYTIINNFILNSVYFLEKETNEIREISFSSIQDTKNVILRMFNNGPALDPQYEDNPNRIFELGETSKENGTGLGLWIMREISNRNNADIKVVKESKGFCIVIEFERVNI